MLQAQFLQLSFHSFVASKALKSWVTCVPQIDRCGTWHACHILGLEISFEADFTCFIVPSAGPDDLTVTVINSTSLLVEWKNVDVCCRNGVTRGYHVLLTDHDQQKIVANLTLFETVFSIGFHDLLPYYAYKVSVKALNVKGVGPASTNVSLTGEGGKKVL